MGAGHAHPLYLPGTSPLHRARPQCKIAATLLFVLANGWGLVVTALVASYH